MQTSGTGPGELSDDVGLREAHKRGSSLAVQRPIVLSFLVSAWLLGGCDGGTDLFVGGDAGGTDASGTDSGSGDTGATTVPLGEIRVATWNVLRHFDETDDRDDPFDESRTAFEFQKKVNDLADVIAAVNPDVIALQEVENEIALNALVDALNERTGRAHVGYLRNRTGLDVAIVSELKVADSNGDGQPDIFAHRETLRRDDGTTTFFARRPLEVIFETGPTQTLRVFSTHLISQISGDDERRELEAAALATIVEARLPQNEDEHVIVAGDFNDDADSASTRAITDVVTDFTTSVAASDRWSHVYRNREVQLDYVLGDAALTATNTRFIHDAIADDVSDHAMIVTDLTL